MCTRTCVDKRVDLPLLQEQISAQRNAAHYQPRVHLQHLADTRAQALALMNDRQNREIRPDASYITPPEATRQTQQHTHSKMITVSCSRINRFCFREETRREKTRYKRQPDLVKTVQQIKTKLVVYAKMDFGVYMLRDG